MPPQDKHRFSPDKPQTVALMLMAVLVILTFAATNLQAIVWKSSSWLVSTVLPAVVVDLTNEERVAADVSPLHRSSILDEAAKLKAEDMAKNEYFAHFSPKGVSPWYWFQEVGYTYAYAGENLAIHFTDSTEMVEAWMDSPKHKENIVNGKFTEIGVGTAKGTYDGYDTVYVVQLFGTPAALPSVQQPEPIVIAQTESLSKPTPKPIPVASQQIELPKQEELIPNEKDETYTQPVDTTATTELSEYTPELPPVVLMAEDDSVIVETTLVSTSSGLVAASQVDMVQTQKAPAAALATQPHEVLRYIYGLMSFFVVALLIYSILTETRRHRYIQVAYGIALLFLMVSLWYINQALTAGAVIV